MAEGLHFRIRGSGRRPFLSDTPTLATVPNTPRTSTFTSHAGVRLDQEANTVPLSSVWTPCRRKGLVQDCLDHRSHLEDVDAVEPSTAPPQEHALCKHPERNLGQGSATRRIRGSTLRRTIYADVVAVTVIFHGLA